MALIIISVAELTDRIVYERYFLIFRTLSGFCLRFEHFANEIIMHVCILRFCRKRKKRKRYVSFGNEPSAEEFDLNNKQ